MNDFRIKNELMAEVIVDILKTHYVDGYSISYNKQKDAFDITFTTKKKEEFHVSFYPTNELINRMVPINWNSFYWFDMESQNYFIIEKKDGKLFKVGYLTQSEYAKTPDKYLMYGSYCQLDDHDKLQILMSILNRE